MVRFFGGVLSSLMGWFPLSAMALGFSPLEQGENMWSDGRVCEWICRAPRRLFYWLKERTRSDDWLAYVIGIPNGRFFFPNAKGFHWTVFMVPELKIFCGFCAKGQEFLRVRLRKGSRIHSKNSKVRIRKHKGIITKQAQKLKFFIYCWNSSIPSTN
jgi:hypothetical protein